MVERRRFLGGLLSALSVSKGRADVTSPLKFLVVADVHYRPGVFPHDNVEWLDRILERAKDEQVDFCLQLGDFVHAARRDKAFLSHWLDFSIPTYSVLGNHDDDGGPHAETLEAFHLTRGYYSFDVKGVRFVVLDTNYACLEGRFVHYGTELGRPSWKIPRGCGMRLHPDELPWLEDQLFQASGPCVVCAHRRLNGEDSDAKAVQSILAQVNARYPGRVGLVLNGHHHCDQLIRKDGISWYTVNSPNHCWVPIRHKAYPVEDVKRWKEIDHIVAYDTPVSAVLTKTASGYDVKGMQGSFWRGVTSGRAGCSPTITPHIQNRTIEI